MHKNIEISLVICLKYYTFAQENVMKIAVSRESCGPFFPFGLPFIFISCGGDNDGFGRT